MRKRILRGNHLHHVMNNNTFAELISPKNSDNNSNTGENSTSRRVFTSVSPPKSRGENNNSSHRSPPPPPPDHANDGVAVEHSDPPSACRVNSGNFNFNLPPRNLFVPTEAINPAAAEQEQTQRKDAVQARVQAGLSMDSSTGSFPLLPSPLGAATSTPPPPPPPSQPLTAAAIPVAGSSEGSSSNGSSSVAAVVNNNNNNESGVSNVINTDVSRVSSGRGILLNICDPSVSAAAAAAAGASSESSAVVVDNNLNNNNSTPTDGTLLRKNTAPRVTISETISILNNNVSSSFLIAAGSSSSSFINNQSSSAAVTGAVAAAAAASTNDPSSSSSSSSAPSSSAAAAVAGGAVTNNTTNSASTPNSTNPLLFSPNSGGVRRTASVVSEDAPLLRTATAAAQVDRVQLEQQSTTSQVEPNPRIRNIYRFFRRYQIGVIIVYCVVLFLTSSYYLRIRPTWLLGDEVPSAFSEMTRMTEASKSTWPVVTPSVSSLEEVRAAQVQWRESFSLLNQQLREKFYIHLTGRYAFWTSLFAFLLLSVLLICAFIAHFVAWLNQYDWMYNKLPSVGWLTLSMMVAFPLVGFFFFDTLLYAQHCCKLLSRAQEGYMRNISAWIEWYYIFPGIDKSALAGSEFHCPLSVGGYSVDSIRLKNVYVLLVFLIPKFIQTIILQVRQRRNMKKAQTEWMERNFQETINVSLNRITADGRIVFRTLFEEKLGKLLGNHTHAITAVYEATRYTTDKAPFLHKMQESDMQNLMFFLLNKLSSKYSASYLAEDMGVPTRSADYYFGITFERGKRVKQKKLRVMVASKALLDVAYNTLEQQRWFAQIYSSRDVSANGDDVLVEYMKQDDDLVEGLFAWIHKHKRLAGDETAYVGGGIFQIKSLTDSTFVTSRPGSEDLLELTELCGKFLPPAQRWRDILNVGEDEYIFVYYPMFERPLHAPRWTTMQAMAQLQRNRHSLVWNINMAAADVSKIPLHP